MDSIVELYIYTTPNWQKQGLVKVGHCIRGRYKKRISEK